MESIAIDVFIYLEEIILHHMAPFFLSQNYMTCICRQIKLKFKKKNAKKSIFATATKQC